MPNNILSIHKGAAGVYRTAAELLIRGYRPYIPMSDSHGVDLLVGNHRVQVKTSQLMTRGKASRQLSYNFDLRHVRLTYSGKNTRTTRIFSNSCDIVVLHGLDQGRFWIVPAKMLDGKLQVVIGEKQRWRELDVAQMQIDRKAGMTLRQIGEKYAIDRITVLNRLRGKYLAPKLAHFSHSIRECEDQWAYFAT